MNNMGCAGCRKRARQLALKRKKELQAKKKAEKKAKEDNKNGTSD